MVCKIQSAEILNSKNQSGRFTGEKWHQYFFINEFITPSLHRITLTLLKEDPVSISPKDLQSLSNKIKKISPQQSHCLNTKLGNEVCSSTSMSTDKILKELKITV